MKTMPKTEIKKNWADVAESLKSYIIFHSCHTLNTKDNDAMRRVFELAQPKVVVGPSYFRIDKEDSEVLTLLIRQYINP